MISSLDTAPFPAITLCNLNPYKASVATDVDLVKRTVIIIILMEFTKYWISSCRLLMVL